MSVKMATVGSGTTECLSVTSFSFFLFSVFVPVKQSEDYLCNNTNVLKYKTMSILERRRCPSVKEWAGKKGKYSVWGCPPSCFSTMSESSCCCHRPTETWRRGSLLWHLGKKLSPVLQFLELRSNHGYVEGKRFPVGDMNQQVTLQWQVRSKEDQEIRK